MDVKNKSKSKPTKKTADSKAKHTQKPSKPTETFCEVMHEFNCPWD